MNNFLTIFINSGCRRKDKVFYRININSRNKFTKSSKNIPSLLFYDQDQYKELNKKTNYSMEDSYDTKLENKED